MVLDRDVPEDGLRRGDLGTVVMTYGPDGIEVELLFPILEPDTGTDGVVMAAEPAQTIRGTVVGPDGKPVAGAWVHAEPVGRLADGRGTETDGRGEFELGWLLPGAWELTAEAGELRGSATITAGAEGVRILLE